MDGQLARVLNGLRETLGSELVGAYLHGSAVLGGLRPRSDVDVLAVTTRATTPEQRRLLAAHLLAVSGTPRPVELTIVVQSDVRPWRYPPRRDFQYGDWWRREFEAGELAPWSGETDTDLASLITMVLLADRALLGPPPADVFDPVPRSDYVRALAQAVSDVLVDIDGDTRNVVLTLARIWCSLSTGEIRTKDGAADWALPQLPSGKRQVLARARAIYLGDEPDRWGDLRPQVHEYARHVVARLEELDPGAFPRSR